MHSYPRSTTAVRVSKIALFLLWATFASVAYNIYSEVRELALIDRVEEAQNMAAGEQLQPTLEAAIQLDRDIEANDERQIHAMIGYLGAIILSTIMLLVWVNRTNHAVRELGATNLQFSPGWAVGYWFVPILNLVRPYQVVRELWVNADVNCGKPGWNVTSPLIGWWWGAWLLSGGLGRVGNNLRVGAGGSLEDLRQADYVFLASHAFDLIALGLTIVVVTKLTQRLAARMEFVAPAAARVVTEGAEPTS